jgi:hypothetical protein
VGTSKARPEGRHGFVLLIDRPQGWATPTSLAFSLSAEILEQEREREHTEFCWNIHVSERASSDRRLRWKVEYNTYSATNQVGVESTQQDLGHQKSCIPVSPWSILSVLAFAAP